jgi:hypothetical protein
LFFRILTCFDNEESYKNKITEFVATRSDMDSLKTGQWLTDGAITAFFNCFSTSKNILVLEYFQIENILENKNYKTLPKNKEVILIKYSVLRSTVS